MKCYEISRDMGIDPLLSKSLYDLSEGQKKSVAIAANLMMGTSLFLFDEPLSNLDDVSRQRFLILLKRLRENNKTIVISEHRINCLHNLADRMIVLHEGEMIFEGRAKDFMEGEGCGEECSERSLNFTEHASPIITVSGLLFRFDKRSDFALKVKGFSAAAGEAVAVTGPNGAGKTTLLRLLSGALIPQKGKICINGKPSHMLSPEKRGKMIRMVLQNADHQLFMYDCLSEVLFPLKSGQVKQNKEWEESASILLDRLGMLSMKKRHPHSMSLGEKKRLAIASALFHRPSLLLLDEPTTGIDKKNLRRLVSVLKEYGEQGMTSIIASHDKAFIYATCHTEISLK